MENRFLLTSCFGDASVIAMVLAQHFFVAFLAHCVVYCTVSMLDVGNPVWFYEHRSVGEKPWNSPALESCHPE